MDNSPLLAFLKKTLATLDDFKRRVTLATVNVNDGTYTQFTQKNLQFTELADAAVASASIPFVFPPHNWEGKGLFMDGGTVYNINIEGAIQQCMDLVDDESKIIIDIFICGAPEHPDVWDRAARTAWYAYYRQHSLHSFYVNTDSVATAMIAHDKVQVRHGLKQKDGFSGFSELNFDGDFTWKAQEAGRVDAQNALNSVGAANKTEFFHEWNSDEQIRKLYPRVGDYINDRTNQVEALELAQF